MIKYISKILGIDMMPKGLLIHLLVLAFSLGGLNAIVFITAISGFINNANLDYYPETIALSGLFGVLLFTFYKYLVKGFSYRSVFIIFFGIVLFILLLTSFLPVFSRSFSQSVLLFICYLPVKIISDQLLLDISEKLTFYKYQQNIKRYLEGGITAGSVFFSLAVFLSVFIIQVPFNITVTVLILVVIAESYIILKQYEPKELVNEEKIDSIITLFTDVPLKFKLLVLLLFIFLSIISFVCIDYVFLYTLSRSFAGLKSLIQFVSIFFVASMLAGLLFKLFVYQNLIKTFRINKAILLSPVFVLLMLLFINFLLFLPVHSDYFKPTLILFTAVVFTRFFAFLLRESFGLYSVRLVLTAISSYSQQWISQNIINLLYIWAFLFGGLTLLFFSSFDFMSIRHILAIVTIASVFWLWISFVLVKNYSLILQKINVKLSENKPKIEDEKIRNLKERVMLTTNLAGMKYLLNFQRYYQPLDFEKTYKEINTADRAENNFTTIPQEDKFETQTSSAYKLLNSDESSLQQINFYDSEESLKINDVEILASSPKTKDRIRAVKMIEQSADLKYAPVFKMLLRDPNDEVQRRAFLAVPKYYNTEIIAELMEYLIHEEYANLVSDVLSKIGDITIPQLNMVFVRTDIDFNTQVQIIRTIGRINSIKAIEFLLKILDYPNKWLVWEAAQAVNDHKLKPDLKDNPALKKAVIKTIGVAAWLLSKEINIDKISPYEPVKKALDEEYIITHDLLFTLLQIRYDNSLIASVKDEFIGVANNEKRELNVELLKLIIEPELQVYLFPLIHNNQKREKVEQLKKYYPISRKEIKGTLKDIINADLGYVNAWSKACALKLYIDLVDNVNSDAIISQVFNPDRMISEVAFFGIYKKNKQITSSLIERIPAKIRNRMLSIIETGDKYEYKLIFNKVLNLQKISYFDKIYGQNLIPFAEVLKENFMEEGDSTFLHCSEEEVLPVFIVPHGQIALIDAQKRHIRLFQNYLYGLGLFAGGITLKAYSDSVVYIARPEQIGHLAINQKDISDAVFKYIQNSNFY